MIKLPPINENVRNLEDIGVVFEIESYEVCEWHPLPDGQGKPEQVHLLLHVKGFPVVMTLRLKSKAAADTLIEALTRHRLAVWPEGNQ